MLSHFLLNWASGTSKPSVPSLKSMILPPPPGKNLQQSKQKTGLGPNANVLGLKRPQLNLNVRLPNRDENYFAQATSKTGITQKLRWCQDNRNRSNQESKFDFLATRECLVRIDEGQQKIKIVCTQIYGLPANHFSPSAKT